MKIADPMNIPAVTMRPIPLHVTVTVDADAWNDFVVRALEPGARERRFDGRYIREIPRHQ